MRIDVVVYDGLDEMDALGPLEVLRSAQRAGADLESRLVARTNPRRIVGSYGLRFEADAVQRPGCGRADRAGRKLGIPRANGCLGRGAAR